MIALFHYKKAGEVYGPYDLELMQDLVRQGQIGRSYPVSINGGASWSPAMDFPDLFVSDPPPADAPPGPTAGESFASASGLGSGVDGGRSRVKWDEPKWDDPMRSSDADERPRRGRAAPRRSGVPLAGFICSTVAVVVLVIPVLATLMLVGSTAHQLVIVPFTALAIVGLILSAQGLAARPRGFAVTGTVLGVIGATIGASALILGLFTWIFPPSGLLIAAREADITLGTSALEKELDRYEAIDREAGEDEESFRARARDLRQEVGRLLGELVACYEGHLTACARTSRFRESFENISKLRRLCNDTETAARRVEGVRLVDVLDSAGVSVRPLKTLLDLLEHHEQGKITLRQAESKVAGL